MADPLSDDLSFASIGELRDLLRARKISSEELTRGFLDRLERLGPRYNALALLLRQDALRQAAEVDRDLQIERFRSPLQGIPYGAKDLLSVAGKITTWGAKPFAAQVFDVTATVLTKIARAGGVLTGKLAMVELAGGGGYRFASASLFGPGLNPWDRTRWSGGSSSGSGSAVAAGLVPWALGSETSGSILTPSAFCGVTGLRPTYGLVSRYGAMPLAWTMDKIGPMCHTAEDCGHVLRVIAGGDSNDPSTAGKGFYFVPQYSRDIKTIRIGFAPADFEDRVEEAARPAFRSAFEALKSLGVQTAEAELADLPYSVVTGTVINVEGASVFEQLIESGEVNQLADAKQIAGLKAALDIPARDYLRAMRIRKQIQDEYRRVFTDVDVLVAPSRFGVAPQIDEPLDRPSPPGPGGPPKSGGLRSLIPGSNLAGLPALSLPCGFVNGLPVGIQLVGRPFSENLLLAIGMQFQKETSWHRERPKV